MNNQFSSYHSMSWFIAQINVLRDQVPTTNFSDVGFLRKANALMSEIMQIDVDVYLLPYETIDRHTVDQLLEHAKKETQKIRLLIRRVALDVAGQSKNAGLLDHISVSLQSLSIFLAELNKELKSDYYLPLFSRSLSNIEGNK